MSTIQSPMPHSAAEFGISLSTGFLPVQPPLQRLPSTFDAWENLALNLPKYLAGNCIRSEIEALPPFPFENLRSEREFERAMVCLSYLGHAYVWTGKQPATRLPAILAIPWHKVASKLGRPPVLSYASYCLHNWRPLDITKNLEVGNIALIQNFYGGIDEEWFILIHVDIEMRATDAMNSIFVGQQAALGHDDETLLQSLKKIEGSLASMNQTMLRMTEFCDPYIYYHRVRPYIHGWRNHPDLPEGLIYEGVEEYAGVPQQFRGETGAQSSIVPALDGFFGVEHKADVLREYLMEMRTYMPPSFRAFIGAVESGPRVREYIAESKDERLVEAYDLALYELEKFRTKHLEYAASYIFKQSQTDAKNPHAVGTGGTPFMPYLRKHRDETHDHLMK